MKCCGYEVMSKKNRLLVMIGLNMGFFFAEISVGEIAGSNALKADAFHMLSDVLALFVAYISVYVSPKKWSRNTYGFARAEVLGALVNSVFLIALCFSIFTDSLKRFFEPEELSDVDLVLIVGSIGLLMNIIGLCLFHDHGHSHGGESTTKHGATTGGHHKHGPQINNHGSDHHHSHHSEVTSEVHSHRSLLATETSTVSTHKTGLGPSSQHHSHAHSHHKVQMNIRGVFLHVLADALGSVIVVVSALVYKYSSDFEYKIYIDPTLSIILVLLIVCATWPLFKDAASILLQSMPNDMEMTKVKERLLRAVPEIEQIHEFHIWQLVATRVVASVHVKMGKDVSKAEHMKTAEKIKTVFHNEGIHSTTVQVEYKKDREVVNKKGCSVPCPRGHSSTKCSEAPLALPSAWNKQEKAKKYEPSSTSLSSEKTDRGVKSDSAGGFARTLSAKTSLRSEESELVLPPRPRKKPSFSSSIQ